MKDNGCNEDGWDLFEEEIRKEFEYYAYLQGYKLDKYEEFPWIYLDEKTDNAWRMFHIGHVKGRSWERSDRYHT